MVGDDFQQFIELGDAQALTDVGLEQAIFFAVREAVGALEFDVFDGETTGVGGGCWQDRFGCLPGKSLSSSRRRRCSSSRRSWRSRMRSVSPGVGAA